MEPTPLQRALAEAPEKSRVEAIRPDEEFFIFRLGALTLAVLSKQVREVSRLSPMTPLPRVPSFLLGAVGNRGQVMPVIDLLRFLQQGESKPIPGGRLFVGESSGLLVAFLADQVIGLRRIFVADKMPSPAGGGAASEFLLGLVQHRELGTVSLLDLPRVLSAARASVVRR
ncbi:MAG: chemotaxis protein CheW [Myxococcaceae bacterium]|nr:chemotaxis protein CheW [Myxococcaceae bacterium]